MAYPEFFIYACHLHIEGESGRKHYVMVQRKGIVKRCPFKPVVSLVQRSLLEISGKQASSKAIHTVVDGCGAQQWPIKGPVSRAVIAETVAKFVEKDRVEAGVKATVSRVSKGPLEDAWEVLKWRDCENLVPDYLANHVMWPVDCYAVGSGCGYADGGMYDIESGIE